MSSADIAAWIGAIAAAGAAAFTGWQLRMLRKQEADAREAEINGVAVSWYPTIVPGGAEIDGVAKWEYDIEVHNPGRLPIRDVNVWLTFPVEFSRVRSGETHGLPTNKLEVGTAVIFAGGRRTWHRTLEMPYAARQDLRSIVARLTFVDGNGHRRGWESNTLRPSDDED